MEIDDREIGLADLQSVAIHDEEVRLSQDPRWRDKMQRSREMLEDALRRGQPVYGVSTGIGHRSSQAIDGAEQQDFVNLIVQHHGCGVGKRFSDEAVRAIIFSRLVSLAKGCSAVRIELLQAMCDLLNRHVLPVIPRLGSVGASGDLTPLSYLAAVLMGEREAIFSGEIFPAQEALKRAGLHPLAMKTKETLALMNGTSVMTGVSVLSALRLERVLTLSERATALAGEILAAQSQAFHPAAHAVKPHPGQMRSAAAMYGALAGSQLIDQPRQGRIVQDPYSIRCAPQVLGATRDALDWTEQVLVRELNSVNDNPIADPDTDEVLLAGNFYGGHVALTQDLLKVATSTVADLLDRQFALLLDSRFNLGLPETLVDYGGNGIKGMQLTASALTARTAQRAAPDSVQSRPTEVNNQDKVSMGLNATLNAAEGIILLQEVLATLLIALSNAAHVRGEEGISPAGKALLEEVRERSEVLTADRRLDRDIAGLVRMINDLTAGGPEGPGPHHPASGVS